MIKYRLRCRCQHEFEGWFPSSKEYTRQKNQGMIQCPMCDSKEVDKAIMAPNIKKAKPKKTMKRVDESTESLNVSVRLATFTLVNVLKNQALFYQALEVLDLLEQKGEDPDMIRLERDSVKALIKTSEKENDK